AVRNILRFVDVLFEIYPLGLAVMFLDPRNRRLGDLAAGTLVIVDKPVSSPRQYEFAPHLLQEDPTLRDVVAAMSAEDYTLLSKFLSRRSGLEPDHRTQLARQIYDRLLRNAAPGAAYPEAVEGTLERLEEIYRERTRIL
ncbi:MAG: hypothetical protein FJY85_22440, partial [Deltaproteobacteria bacterium]|nr:hypothetical protein [Deltaproteobacteria bacterium]